MTNIVLILSESTEVVFPQRSYLTKLKGNVENGCIKLSVFNNARHKTMLSKEANPSLQ